MVIRQAVGAVALYKGNVILVYKVKGAQGSIQGMWDLPKGGLEPHDTSIDQALFRELREETGSTQYRIVKRYDESIYFDFDQRTTKNWAVQAKRRRCTS
ncbi:NUDIX hydrolase [Marinicrinis lubricantis]|uniref:NUDIX hydrolase n=1 Tax=Marinicrinis lubricantis TaxID=2086470 RepID=A0ABW1IK28_9BACL